MIDFDRTKKAAVISDCGKYRYWLERMWNSEQPQPIIMLNPSTADADLDDPTIRRCISFARREGRGGIIVVNLYGLRATDPAQLKTAHNPIGPDNDGHVGDVARWAARVDVPILCAWGSHAAQARADRILRLIQYEGAKTVCLGITKGGHPKHPLYVHGDQPFVAFPAMRAAREG